MHAEAVKPGATPSKPGLIRDRTRPLSCAECNLKYHLYYDREAEISFTFCKVLAGEIIAARHPDHASVVVLELPEPDRAPKRELVWSIRMDLGELLKKKPDTT